MSSRRHRLVDALRDKEFREAFVSEGVDTAIPLQIRANREARGWSQRDLADRMNTKQEGVSRLENVNYGKMTLSTLKVVAAAFDVGLLVRLVPFGKLIDEIESMAPKKLVVPSFIDERLESEAATGPPADSYTTLIDCPMETFVQNFFAAHEIVSVSHPVHTDADDFSLEKGNAT